MDGQKKATGDQSLADEARIATRPTAARRAVLTIAMVARPRTSTPRHGKHVQDRESLDMKGLLERDRVVVLIPEKAHGLVVDHDAGELGP